MFCPSVSAIAFSGTVPSRRLATVELTHERACGLAGVPGGVGERVVYSFLQPLNTDQPCHPHFIVRKNGGSVRPGALTYMLNILH